MVGSSDRLEELIDGYGELHLQLGSLQEGGKVVVLLQVPELDEQLGFLDGLLVILEDSV